MPFPNPVRVFWVDETAQATGCVWGYGRGNNCAIDCYGKPATEESRKLCCKTKTQYIDHGLKPWPAPVIADIRDRLDTVCERCGRPIPEIEWYSGSDTLYRLPGVKTWSEDFAAGIMVPLDVVPVGAMWDAHWLAGDSGEDRGYTGPDGISLCVKLPNGHHWNVDSEASNCDRPQRVPIDPPEVRGPVTSTTRFQRSHYCWRRTGDPRLGICDVGKGSEAEKHLTCGAGSGSIWVDKDGPRDWHGFLWDSKLVLA